MWSERILGEPHEFSKKKENWRVQGDQDLRFTGQKRELYRELQRAVDALPALLTRVQCLFVWWWRCGHACAYMSALSQRTLGVLLNHLLYSLYGPSWMEPGCQSVSPRNLLSLHPTVLGLQAPSYPTFHLSAGIQTQIFMPAQQEPLPAEPFLQRSSVEMKTTVLGGTVNKPGGQEQAASIWQKEKKNSSALENMAMEITQRKNVQ